MFSDSDSAPIRLSFQISISGLKHCKNGEPCSLSLLIVGNKDCHEFSFSTVRIVISVSNVKSLVFVIVKMVKNYQMVKNGEKCQKIKIVNFFQNCPELSKIVKKL